MADKVIFHIVFENDSLTEQCLLDAFQGLVFFKATEMMGTEITGDKRKKYKESVLVSGLKKEVRISKMSVFINDECYNTLEVYRGYFHSTLIGTLSNELFEANKDKLLNLLDDFFQNYSGISGFCCSLEDNYLQNLKDVTRYIAKGKSTDNLIIIQDPIFKNRQMIDVEYNPGHSHIVSDLWFGSCWRMWFGHQFFQYIPKDVILNFKDGYETQELTNGSVRITLYEDMCDYEKTENREIQWKFRRQVGMDEVAHQLEGQPIVVENPDPAIEIFTKDLQHGGARGITYYFNNEKEVVPKSKATESHSYEFDQYGEVIWSEVKKL
ncbi:hypothetical protein AV540_25650 [Brevibacillus parabrevis]|uniref:hypothetical protein n=1 Tax=Brevibacillus parabrevis TaxID=54914 RepID=UPI0007AC1A9C|nr:hypothetical protein [Brevibacillus parabrevis]KZE42254.1 hypothetical protein AV540_25650 [Brevibacillus parabrevis]